MYKMTEGIVLTRVGGEYVLVATRSAWDKCPNIKSISPLFSAFWQGLFNGISEETMIQQLSQNTKIAESVLKERLSAFYDEMRKDGYLYEEETV